LGFFAETPQAGGIFFGLINFCEGGGGGEGEKKGGLGIFAMSPKSGGIFSGQLNVVAEGEERVTWKAMAQGLVFCLQEIQCV